MAERKGDKKDGFGRRVLFGATAALAIGTGTALAGSKLTAKAPPVGLTAMASSGGWILHFHLPPNAHSIAVRLPDDEVFESLAQPSMTISFDRAKRPIRIAVRWRDENGLAHGPVLVDFDPGAQAVLSVRSILGVVAEWIAFRDFDQQTLLYFTTLLVYKYAIAEIHWSFDSDDLDRTVRFTPSDRPGIANDDEVYVRLPARPEYVALQISFIDGTKSAVKRFAPPKDPTVTGATMLGNRVD